ncbi:MAG: hypothetical protein ABJM11_16670 [Marinobacter sp.]|uniref:hypothetical protein n=1 Tax=Marinobacter sp. TaxID=50741 RepID=UPI0032986B02
MGIKLGKVNNFLKDHILGVFLTSVAAGLLSTWLFQVFPFANDEREVVKGEIVLTHFGEYTEKYGVRFDSPPKLQFLNEYGSTYSGGAVDVLEHGNDGFVYKLARGFAVGEQLTWVATGTLEEN